MIGDNIKKLREVLKLTQQKLADQIGIKQNSVALIESNKRNISKQALLSISREFGVRLEWLETGEGEMFEERDDSPLVQLAAEYNLNDNDVAAIKSFLELPPEHRKGVIEWGRRFASRTAAQMGIDFPLVDEEKVVRKPDSELTREERHARLDEELDAEEAARKRGAETSSAFTGTSGLFSKKING